MAGLYHINGDSVSPCRAQKGNCPYGQGEEENHFKDAGEAMKVLETRLANEYGAVNSGVKKSDHDVSRGVAAARGMDTTEYDRRVAAGESPAAVAAAAKIPSTAKDLAARGADPKDVRDALRRENPTWNDRRIHTVEKQMTKGGSNGGRAPKKSSTKTASASAPTLSPESLKNLHNERLSARQEIENARRVAAEVEKRRKKYDELNGVNEGRAFYYGPSGETRIGKNPSGRYTFYKPHPKYIEARDNARAQMEAAIKKEQNAQTAIEEAGFGHTIPDEGNTIRVNNQAQKWLLENELKGQISDGKWENSGPQDHWQPWSNAKVVVDPQNPGRNFPAQKDNYQLNSKDLLDVVGDRMVEDVKASTGKDYDDKQMMKDLRELRGIFKTSRPPRT